MTYLELYEQTEYELEQNLITLGEYVKKIKPLEQEVRQTGHWIKDGDSYSDLYDFKIRCHCSICGNKKVFFDRKTTIGTPCIKNCDNVDKYCSNCGAKMEGE